MSETVKITTNIENSCCFGSNIFVILNLIYIRSLKRYGSVIGVKPEKLEEYKKLHAAVWPDVLTMIKECNIRNYSIFYRDGMLYSYYEYIGDDYEKDMQRMAADPITQEWWKLTDPCQQALENRRPGEWWAAMEEVFHTD